MRLIWAGIMSLAAGSVASDPFLDLPVDCTLGETCHIQQYVDRDLGEGFRDFNCRNLSYDGHKGTDFSLPTLSAMKIGVDVLAAAPGTVKGVRDQMPDRFYTSANAASVEGRECGNGVVVAHHDGWETQYCHLKRGTVRVEPGDKVDRGTVLGQVGLSGKTQFPHLHLSVRRNGEVVDPFSTGPIDTCGTPGENLWRDTLDYVPGALIEVGFAPRVPSYAEIHTGETRYSFLPSDGEAIVLWGFAFGGLKGDILRIEIDGPNGPFASYDSELEKDQARYFRAYGKRLKTESWPTGTYKGRVTLIRDGKEISRSDTTAQIY